MGHLVHELYPVPEYLSTLEIDALDGKPIRYERKGTGYVLYSVEENRADHGGGRDENGEAYHRIGR